MEDIIVRATDVIQGPSSLPTYDTSSTAQSMERSQKRLGDKRVTQATDSC